MSLSSSDAVFIAFIGMLLLFAVVSNILVIVIVCRNKAMRNVTNILICNLSLSDLILAGIILPQNLHDLSHEDEFYEGPFLCKTAFAFPILCITTSSYTLAMMAYERRNCIVNSLKTQITVQHCKFIIPGIWILSALTTTPTMVEFSIQEEEKTVANITTTHLYCNGNGVPHSFVVANGIILLFVTYVIPLGIILYSYSKVIHFVAGRKSLSSGQQSEASTTTSVVMKKRMKIFKMLIIVTALFAVSWLPYFVTLIIEKVTGNDGSENISTGISLLKICLAGFSTAYNIILYVIFNAQFRNAFKELLPCCKQKKVEHCSQDPSGSKAHDTTNNRDVKFTVSSAVTTSSSVN